MLTLQKVARVRLLIGPKHLYPTVRDEGHVNKYGLIHQSVLGSCAIISQMSLLLAGWRQVCFPQRVKLSSQCTGRTEGLNVM